MTARIVVFGAFDRHNLGDLLFAHVAEALLGEGECVFAGLADRDLRPSGGHPVHTLGAVVRQARNEGNGPLALLHAGGEILGCDAWQAAVMLLAPDEAARVVSRLAAHPRERERWAREVLAPALGCAPAEVPRAPYVASRISMPGIGPVAFNAVGGVELRTCDESLRAEVSVALRSADFLSVRDEITCAQLLARGLDPVLIPDPAVLVGELFGEEIRRRSNESPQLARVRDAFPGGWVATQFSADFGDDATLESIATQLDAVHADTGLGFALFRAGAAPWHDSLDVLKALASRMRAPVLVFESIHLWEVCALIACSRGFCGSSLHGRIVASAFGLARVNASHPSTKVEITKQHAYAACWERDSQPGVVSLPALGAGLRTALAVDLDARERHAKALASIYSEGFASIRRALSGCQGMRLHNATTTSTSPRP